MATMPPISPPINSIAIGTAIPTGDTAMRASAEMVASTSMMSVATNAVADGWPSTFGRRLYALLALAGGGVENRCELRCSNMVATPPCE
jgi:hypothetical protein